MLNSDKNISKNDEIEIDLKEIFRLLVSKSFFIILTSIGMAALAFIISSKFTTPTYKSTTKIYVLNQQDTSTVTYTDLQTGLQLTKDYEELIKSKVVIEQVINELQLKYAYAKLRNNLIVEATKDTRIIKISVENEDPYMAKEIADKVRVIAAEQIERVMDIKAVKTVEEADIPKYSSNASPRKIILLGFVFGFIASSAIVVIIKFSNDKICTPDDIERYLGISTLGTIVLDKNTITKRRQKNKLYMR